MATVIPLEALRRNPASALFEGGDAVAISIFVTEFGRGEGPPLHRHPYPEVFVVEAGTAAFRLGDEEHVVTGGHIVVVPAEAPHAFTSGGDEKLRVLSIHPSGTIQQTLV